MGEPWVEQQRETEKEWEEGRDLASTSRYRSPPTFQPRLLLYSACPDVADLLICRKLISLISLQLVVDLLYNKLYNKSK